MDSSSAGARKQGNIALVRLPTRLIDVLNIKRSGKVPPTLVKTKSSETLEVGSGGVGAVLKAFPSIFLQIKPLKRKSLTACLPLIIQNVLRSLVSVSLTPLCFTFS